MTRTQPNTQIYIKEVVPNVILLVKVTQYKQSLQNRWSTVQGFTLVLPRPHRRDKFSPCFFVAFLH